MKCEKCGIEITEGTLCVNCKNDVEVVVENNDSVKIVDVVENISSSETVSVEEQPDVMNMIDEKVETKEENFMESFNKTEIENSIPLGDNIDVPAVPVNENVVLVKDPVIEEDSTPDVKPEEGEKVEEVVSTPMEQVVVEKKKSKGGIIVISLIVLAAVAFVVYKFFIK